MVGGQVGFTFGTEAGPFFAGDVSGRTLSRADRIACSAVSSGGRGGGQHQAAHRERDFGDIAEDGVDEGYLEDDQLNELSFELGGGVMVPFGRACLDIGDRFMKVTDSDDVHISRVSGGLGVRF
jgi:hypothetical protein